MVTEACEVGAHRSQEGAMRRAEQKYARLFRLSPVSIALMTYREGRFVEVNRTLLRNFGFEESSMIGRTDLEIGLWRCTRQRSRLMRRLSREWRVEKVRVDLIDGVGEQRAVELSAERFMLDGRHHVLVVGRDVTRERAIAERLVNQAFYDPLTGLPNRTRAEERLSRAVEAGCEATGRTAVLFIDLDGLKRINDSLGHMAGDRILVAAAERLRRALPPTDFLARFGGDELVAVLRVDRVGTAVNIAEDLLAALGKKLEVADTILRPKASIGVAVAESGSGVSARDLLRFADVAMYRAKRRSGNCVELFDAQLDGSEIRNMELEHDLNLALERGEMHLVFQPIVRLGDLSVWGAEALVRWNHPQRGVISPGQFIPIAERNGSIRPLGRWVLEETCRQLASWHRRNVVKEDFVVSINVSAQELEHGNFLDRVTSALRRYRLPAESLQLELTEREAVRQADEVRELERLGLRIAIDDFGQGYGSLSYLRSLPVDTLKLDRQFTRDLTVNPLDLSLVRTVVYLTDSLGLDLVVEGVEMAEQLRVLREMGCQLGQGFLFAEALSPEELAETASAPSFRGLRLIHGGQDSVSSASTRDTSCEAEKGLARKGMSPSSSPRALRTSSR